MDQYQPQPNHEIQPLWVQEIWIVPNGYTLAGFASGALPLTTITAQRVSSALHLTALRKIKQ